MTIATRRRRIAAFTLVELMMVVAIIGILAAIALPAFTRQVKRSKTAEAYGHLNRMWGASVAYYEADHGTAAGVALPKTFPGLGVFYLRFVLATPPAGAQCGCRVGGKCRGTVTYWNTTGPWRALAFSIPGPFSYDPYYSTAGIGTSAVFTASAQADLDCDGTLARFERTGYIDPTTGDVAGGTNTYFVNELE